MCVPPFRRPVRSSDVFPSVPTESATGAPSDVQHVAPSADITPRLRMHRLNLTYARSHERTHDLRCCHQYLSNAPHLNQQSQNYLITSFTTLHAQHHLLYDARTAPTLTAAALPNLGH